MASSAATRQPGSVGDLARLKQSAFGRPRELAVRLGASAAVALGLFAYMQDALPLYWIGGYLVTQLVLALLLSNLRGLPPRIAYYGAFLVFLSASLSFAWLPVWLLGGDDTTLIYCSLLALACLCVYNLWREEPPDFVIYVDVIGGWAIMLLALAVFLPEMGTLAEQMIIATLALIFVGYYSAALVSAQRYRQQLREAAERGIHSQKMEAIGQLSGGIAHDFNNILTVVQGNLELYGEVADPRERAALVDEARTASLRAKGLVSKLLTFARRAPLSEEELDVAEVLAEMEVLSRRMLPESITFKIAGPKVGLRVRADRDGLTSALLNLIINARDAMEDRGTITLRAALHPGEAAAPGRRARAGIRHLALSVRDSGPGMPPHVAEQALEPFFTTKEIGEGSGLGLSMASGFAQQSGGVLKIASTTAGSARGTTVTLHLPVIS